MTGRLLRPLLLAVGVGFIAWLVWDLGPATVWETIRTLSWRLALLVVLLGIAPPVVVPLAAAAGAYAAGLHLSRR